MGEWWSAMGTEEQIYWAIALASSTVVLVQTLLSLVGADGLGDADVDFDIGDAGHGSGAGVLSLRTIFAFGVGFGWAGVVAIDLGWNSFQTGMAGTVAGIGCGAIVFQVMRWLYQLRHSGTVDFANAVGNAASVYVPIPPKLGGNGQVSLNVQGRFRVLSACSKHDERLENRSHVRVIEVLDNNVLLVEPLMADDAPADAAKE